MKKPYRNPELEKIVNQDFIDSKKRMGIPDIHKQIPLPKINPQACPFMDNETARKLPAGRMCGDGGKGPNCVNCGYYNQWKFRREGRQIVQHQKRKTERLMERMKKEGSADFLYNMQLPKTPSKKKWDPNKIKK